MEALAASLGSAQVRVGESPPSFFTDVPSHDWKRAADAGFKLAGAVLDGGRRLAGLCGSWTGEPGALPGASLA